MAAALSPAGARSEDLNDLTPVSADTLKEQRGGFIEADGIAFDFGAVLRTSVDGQLALETVVTWTPQGLVTQQTMSAEVATGLNEAATLQSALASGAGVTLVGSGPGSAGQTVLVQQVNGTGVQNLVLNTANNQTINQSVGITLTIANGASFVSNALMASLGQGFNASGVEAALASVRH